MAQLHLSRGAGSRNRWPCGEGGPRCDEIQGRRPGRSRLHGGFLSHLPQLPAWSGAVLQMLPTFTYNSPDKHLGGYTFRRLCGKYRGRRGVYAQGFRT